MPPNGYGIRAYNVDTTQTWNPQVVTFIIKDGKLVRVANYNQP